jgi:hypothetical protein
MTKAFGSTSSNLAALELQELNQHNQQLECLLAALVLRFGVKGVLALTNDQIRATRGLEFDFELGADLGVDGGGVRLTALPPEPAPALVLAIVQCAEPGMMQ